MPSHEWGKPSMHTGRLTASMRIELTDDEMTSRLDVVVTENELCDRLAEAEAGAIIAYHIGLLARDRDKVASTLPPERLADLNAVAGRAWRLAEAGWADLVQRRVGVECFAYLLIIRCRPLSARSTRAQMLPSLLLTEVA